MKIKLNDTTKNEEDVIRLKQDERILIIFEELVTAEEIKLISDLLERAFEQNRAILINRKCKFVVMPKDSEIKIFKLSNTEIEEIIDAILDSGYVQFEIEGYGWGDYSIAPYMEKEDIKKIKPSLEKTISEILSRLCSRGKK